MEFILNSTGLLISIWVALAVVLLFILAKTPLSITKKMLIVFLTFVLLYVTIIDTVKLLGYPMNGHPSKEFQFVGYRTDSTEEGKYIILWVRAENGDRLYRFPHSDKVEDQLKEAQESSSKGIRQMGKFDDGKRKPDSTDKSEDKLKIYKFPHQSSIPKDQQ